VWIKLIKNLKYLKFTQTIDLVAIRVNFVRFKGNFITGRPVNNIPLEGIKILVFAAKAIYSILGVPRCISFGLCAKARGGLLYK